MIAIMLMNKRDCFTSQQLLPLNSSYLNTLQLVFNKRYLGIKQIYQITKQDSTNCESF